LLREHTVGLNRSEIARAMAIDRTAAYRLLRTLEAHHLVSRDDAGRYQLGLGLIELHLGVQPNLRAAAAQQLQMLANSCGATAFVTMVDGEDGVVVSVVEPAQSGAHVAYRVGVRHPLDRGAPGLAILASRPQQPGERTAVEQARKAGYAVTSGELQPGAWGLAAPIRLSEQPADASVGIVTLTRPEVESLAPRVIAAAETIARMM
jgi:DNA-binding IclR family transcriptional regulator